MKNQYKIRKSEVVLYLQDQKGNITNEAVIDLMDLNLIKQFPNTWRLQSLKNRMEVRGTYRVEGEKKQTTLAKWILDFPKSPIYFKDGSTLNHKRENLTFEKPLKANKITIENNIGYLYINRRHEDDLKIKIDTDITHG
ncbi:hypothetical protein [Neobacillus niacini]|uniref:hypothetical protein n=1 Tax=Neobacillus niacini TaxID=86668 RepID=UPI0021CAFD0D|nr:hypothetical protein [Neobacillus niacini]MCM3764485.1 hypothetical protein [Neobacillus niacini]